MPQKDYDTVEELKELKGMIDYFGMGIFGLVESQYIPKDDGAGAMQFLYILSSRLEKVIKNLDNE